MPLSLHSSAPNFSLKDKEGKIHELKKIRAHYIVLYFYPKDNTAGCTIEAVEFTRNLDELEKLGAIVIGISGGDEKSKTTFCINHNLKVLLLSDPDFAVCKKYEVYGEKKFLGKIFNGIKRITFIIHKGKIIKVFDKVYPKEHVQEVMLFLKSLQ